MVSLAKEHKPDAILLHVGTNLVKNRNLTTFECADKISHLISETLRSHSNAQIIISPILPCAHKMIDDKAKDVNCIIWQRFKDTDRVHTASSRSVRVRDSQGYVFLKDAYHLTQSGVNLLASNFKNAVKKAMYH